jgi:hypothetical protein
VSDEQASPAAPEPYRAKVRFTLSLPDGVIWYQAVEFDWPEGTKLGLVEKVKPLFDWMVDRFAPWTEAA